MFNDENEFIPVADEYRTKINDVSVEIICKCGYRLEIPENQERKCICGIIYKAVKVMYEFEPGEGEKLVWQTSRIVPS